MAQPSSAPLNWLFVDMNSFFASAEQHLRPGLRGRPVGVIPVETEGTCLIAASKEAKAFGLKTGTRVREAKEKCPEIELVRARPDVYVRMHHEIGDSIERWAPIHKAYSIDEWAVRLGHGQHEPKAARQLGVDIKRQIYSDFSPTLGCSVGIAPTRLLAKIASDIQKPDGLTLIEMKDLPERLDGCEPENLCGIGRGIAARLEHNGIRTVPQLWALSRRQAKQIWGSIAGAQWWDAFHGRDEPEIPTRKGSMGHANVLDPKYRNEEGARGILARLVCRLGIRMRAEGYTAGALGINIVYVGEGGFVSSIDLPHIQDTRTLLETLNRLLDRCTPMQGQPLKVGAVVTRLVHESQIAGNLFEEAEREVGLSKTMDKINSRWGLSSIYFGSLHGYRHHMDDKIAFGRIPPEITLNDHAEQTH
ncbi:MAG: type VI secretion protein ImpB [Phycisphaera sp.]|nr:MAG: type VI secretion protein ImpB [Phycisphaera sp.]